LKGIAGSRVTSGGELLITARRFRTQDANRVDARRRLVEMIAAAHIAPIKRRATRPTRAAKAQRVETKRQRSQVKQGRGKVDYD
jgi:ribosome-associated protein